MVEFDGMTMLAGQAAAMLAAGADSIVAIINSETARIAQEKKLAIPAGVRLVVRDTPNSMETMLALKEFLEPGWFLAATVDAVIPQTELARFVNEARRKTELYNDKNFAGVLALTPWRARGEAPF